MRYFDLIYLVLFDFYSNIYGDKPEGGSACFFVAGLPFFNILTVILTYCAIAVCEPPLSKVFIIGTYIILFVFFYYRYIYIDKIIQDTRTKWEGMTKQRQRSINSMVLYYVMVTFVSMFYMTYYWASRHSD
jgi:hypothetical protein